MATQILLDQVIMSQFFLLSGFWVFGYTPKPSLLIIRKTLFLNDYIYFFCTPYIDFGFVSQSLGHFRGINLGSFDLSPSSGYQSQSTSYCQWSWRISKYLDHNVALTQCH